MERMPMCRICLVENVRMYIVVDKDLHELYETLTNIPFVTEDRRPALACFLCFAKLKQCYQLQRKCLEAEERFAQMMNEPNYVVNRSQLKHSSGLAVTPVKNISIAGVSHNESIVIKEELPDVCERRDDVIKTEEHQSDDVELESVYKIYVDLEDTPALHCSETDSKYDVLLMELQLKTELEEEQVLRKKQRVSDTTRSTPATAADIAMVTGGGGGRGAPNGHRGRGAFQNRQGEGGYRGRHPGDYQGRSGKDGYQNRQYDGYQNRYGKDSYQSRGGDDRDGYYGNRDTGDSNQQNENGGRDRYNDNQSYEGGFKGRGRGSPRGGTRGATRPPRPQYTRRPEKLE